MGRPSTKFAASHNTVQLLKFSIANDSTPRVGCLDGASVIPIAFGQSCLSDVLHARDVEGLVRERVRSSGDRLPVADMQILPPLDDQEVWGAGVTYQRSKVARERESEQAASFYDRVYTADRPELFFKATPSRVVGPGQPIRVRCDSSWTVPEPELALVLNPALDLVGFTIGNDVSARDIEGENPLYLPQAKVYDACCALGPVITLASAMPAQAEIGITLEIARGGIAVFKGETSVSRMARRFEDLIAWLKRDNMFPRGAILLTGTGIVPPDEFSLKAGDNVRISIDGIGTLENNVVQASRA